MKTTGDKASLNYKIQGLRTLMNGEYRSAIRNYQSAMRNYEAQDEIKLELACALAGNREYDAAKAILQDFQFADLTPTAKARFLAAEALLRSHEFIPDAIPSVLEEAISHDARFPLSHFALGKYYQVVEKDSSKALDYLRNASEFAKLSYGPLIHLISLELAEGNYQSARTLRSRLIRDFPLIPRTVMAFMISHLLSTPYRGRLLLLIAGISLCIPYWGPVFIGVWSLGTIASYILFRKQSTYFLAFSLVSEVWFLIIYLLRSLFLGLFP